MKPSRARSSNSSSGRLWELDQTPAVRGPTHIAEVDPGDSASDGDAQRRVAGLRRVDACCIVVGVEVGELSFEVSCVPEQHMVEKLAISEFPKGRKYLISLSFRGKASVRPAQVGGFDVNIVIHGSTAVRGRGDLVAYRWALWKLTAPWTHRTRPPHLGKRCAFSTSSTGPFPSNHSRKTTKGPKIALGNPDRPEKFSPRCTDQPFHKWM